MRILESGPGLLGLMNWHGKNSMILNMENPVAKSKYFFIPICFLQKIDQKDGLNSLMSWAIIDFSSKISFDLEEVARQTIYSYYRHAKNLPEDIFHNIELLVNEGKLNIDEEYCGFIGSKYSFDPVEEIKQILDEFHSDEEFQAACVCFYRFRQACGVLNITANYSRCYQEYNTLERFRWTNEEQMGKDAYASVRTDLVFDAREGKLPSELFRFYVACKSIIGRRNFNSTSSNVLIMRMLGAKSKKALEAILEDSNNTGAKELFQKLSKRYQFNKLLESVNGRSIATVIPATRGYYISISFSLEQLTEAVKRNIAKRSLARNRMAGYDIREFEKSLSSLTPK